MLLYFKIILTNAQLKKKNETNQLLQFILVVDQVADVICMGQRKFAPLHQ